MTDYTYRIFGSELLITLTGDGHFDEDGNYCASLVGGGWAVYNTAESYDYFGDCNEDCIDWERPYLVANAAGDTIYQVSPESAVQTP